MTFETLTWAFVLAVAVHNLEEALWLPAWSQRGGRWRLPVGVREFSFAVAVLTVAAAAAAWLAQIGGKGSIGAYLVCGYALAMLLNVVFPHVLATAILREYVPGTPTALLPNLPVCYLLLQHALRDLHIDVQVFLWAGPLTALAILAAIPLLFAIGRRLPHARLQQASRRGAVSGSSDVA